MKQDITKQSSIWNAPPKKIFLIWLIVGVVTFNIMVGYNDVNHTLDSSTNKEESTNVKSSSGSINSATGTTFENKRIRTFKHHEQNEQSNVGVGENENMNMNMPTIPSMTKHCKRWGVVTTIFDPNEAITRIVEMPSWCLVIVPDTKTPTDYMEKLNKIQKQNQDKDTPGINNSSKKAAAENVFYFTIEKQKEWERIDGPFGSFVRLTPWRHFCRKNIGYLFAILHGAEYIFDFDDDNFIKLDSTGMPLQILPDGDDPSTMTLKNVNVIMQGANAFNHHPIMNASIDESWARGFPMGLIQDKHTQGQVAYKQNLPFASHDKEIGVIQFLADGNPDIDAMHRLSKPLPMTFPLDGAKSVLVPTHAYAPYNAQATIHTKNAMWAMLLPGTVPGRVSDIWRSYFAQCIFADAGLQLVFSPPKIVQERNEHDYLGDFNAEQDLYNKSGKLVEFLSEWDSKDADTIPKRMEQLWIDLYEFGYIEVDDVYAVQAWLGALDQAGYTFPALKRRYRNVAVMGQFNYADGPSVVDDVIFWTQKNRERFDTVVAAGPFSEDHMLAFEENSIDAISNHNDITKLDEHGLGAGYYTPLENLKDTLLRFKDSDKIEGVAYAHDDGILNATELSQGAYPFPADKIIAPGDGPSNNRYADVRKMKPKSQPFKSSYRIFPDGHLEDFRKTKSFNSINELVDGVPLHKWDHYTRKYCGIGQTELAKDPDSARYREEDGSILFPPYSQADFMFVPTEHAEEFAMAAELHLKHGIWIECAFNTITDMVRRQTNVTVRSTRLCTDWEKKRGTGIAIAKCRNDGERNYGFIHPYKIGGNGYKGYSRTYDILQAFKS